MKKISIAFVSIVAMAGVAGAQQKGSGAAPAGGAAAGAKAGAGSAAAPAKPDAKAGAGGAAAAAPMEMPKPPAEIAAALKAMGARANCTGTGVGPDMKTEVPFKGTMTHKSDLDGWWIHGSVNATMGTGKTAMKFKLEMYQTYDPKMGKWRITGVSNDGGNMAGTGDMKDGKWESTSDLWTNMGQAMMREHGDMTDKKAGMHMWGEASMDKGKTWNKMYDMTCK
ncbi:MAG TPA: hypothetical protein VLB44_03545 [Kofleriaceae bacterium]|nr:hypothetical protein [Kofleriaceae bacterium]